MVKVKKRGLVSGSYLDSNTSSHSNFPGNFPGIFSKSQITSYIIIGILILFSIAVLYSFQERDIAQSLLRKYDPDVEPIAVYVTQCLQDSLQQGISNLAAQGGYLYFPPKIASELPLTIPISNQRKVPLWFYEGEILMPSVKGMERQLNRYIEEHAINCIAPIEDSPQPITIVTNLSANVSIQIESVSVVAAMTIQVSLPDGKKQVSEYEALTPTRLLQMWELGRKISRFEMSTRMLENATIELMSTNSEIPFTNLFMDCSPKVWLPARIKSQLGDILSFNFNNIRITKTDYPEFLYPEPRYEFLRVSRKNLESDLNKGIEDITRSRYYVKDTPADAFDYFHLFWDVGASPSNLKVSVQSSPEFGMDFNSFPTNDGVMKSKVIKGADQFLPFVCMNVYHFVYDIYYPVKIDIRDDSSFSGKGLVLSFALPVSITANEPSPLTQRVSTVLEEVPTPEGFCEHISESVTELRAFGIDEEGYSSNAGLGGVDFIYICAGRKCSLGQSFAQDGSYKLVSNLPSGCDRPIIRVSKQGYLGDEKQLRSRQPSLNLNLIRLKPFSFDVVKHPYLEGDSSLQSPIVISKDNTVVLTLKATSPKNYTQIIVFPENASFVDGSADSSLLDVPLLSNDYINLLEASATYDLDIILTRKTSFGDQLIGGARLTNFSFRQSDVSQNNKLIFHAIEYRPAPISEEDEKKVVRFIASEAMNASLRPELKQVIDDE